MFAKTVNGSVLRTIALSLAALTLFSCTRDSFEKDYPIPSLSITKAELSEAQQGYMNAGNQFSLDLLHELYEGNNIVLSPLGVQMALGMTLNGANGSTAAEIVKALNYGTGNEKDINEYCKLLLEQLPQVDKSVKLKFANAVVSDIDFSLKDTFRNTLKRYYYAPAESYSFRSPEALDRVNEWARRNTNGLIDPFITEFPDNTAALVLSSVYFKARWKYSIFKYEEMEERPFRLEDGTTQKLSFLHAFGEFGYHGSESLDLLEVPYADDAYSMFIILPKDGSAGSCSRLLASLTEDSLRSCIKSEQSHYASIYIPAFDIESDLKLKQTLKALGISKAFDGTEADFSRMFESTWESQRPYIYEVLQKTKISTTKEGTEAASVTAVEIVGETDTFLDETGMLVFDANHPFIFVIAEKGTGAILFEGVFSARAAE